MFYKSKKPSFAQLYASLALCPLSKNGKGVFKKNYFYWEFDIKPSTFSKLYKILLIWDIKTSSPNVFVLDTDVWEVAEQRDIPHLYDYKKIKLCLYHPLYNQYNRNMSLCETIVAWTYLWLFYYEEWLYSDDWKGGGEHPKPKKEPKKISPLKKIRVSKKRNKEKPSLVDRIYNQRKDIYSQQKSSPTPP